MKSARGPDMREVLINHVRVRAIVRELYLLLCLDLVSGVGAIS
jgi:hypothetical protein